MSQRFFYVVSMQREQLPMRKPTPTHMKNTLSVYEIADALKQDEHARWSYEGSKALAEYLDQLDQETGEDTELDVVAIRCDWSEYETSKEAAENQGWESSVDPEDHKNSDGELDEDELEEAIEEEALTWLQDHTQVIEFKGGIIIAQF